MNKQCKQKGRCGKPGCSERVGFTSFFCEDHEYERYAPVFGRAGITVSDDMGNSYMETF